MLRHSPSKSLSGLILLLIASGLWPGCITAPAGALEEVRESRHFSTFESGFSISAREGLVRYLVKLRIEAPSDSPLFLDVRYENPENPAAPHRQTVEIAPAETLVTLESPPLRHLEPGRYYHIEIDVFLDREQTALSDSHDVLIFSTIDTKSHGR